jgi:hypothetical protein
VCRRMRIHMHAHIRGGHTHQEFTQKEGISFHFIITRCKFFNMSPLIAPKRRKGWRGSQKYVNKMRMVIKHRNEHTARAVSLCR